MSLDYLHNSDNSCPVAVVDDWADSICLPNTISCSDYAALLKALAPLLTRVSAGYETVPNGFEAVGKFTPQANVAKQEVEGLIREFPYQDVGIWDAYDWFVDGQPNDLLTISDSGVADLAARLTAEALETGHIVLRVEEYIRDHRA